MASINAGMVVQLKSGGPCMTVRRIHMPTGGSLQGISLADCQWFEDQKAVSGDFPVASLEIIPDDE